MICGYIRETSAKRHSLFAFGEYDVQRNTWLRCETSFALNEVDGAELTLPWSILAVRSLTQKNAVIELEDDGETVFIGELASVRRSDFDFRVALELDGALGWLGNICKAPFVINADDVNSTPANFLTAIIEQYNAAVDASRKIQLGTVTVTGHFSMNHQEEYVNMLDLLREVREQLGGYYFMTYGSGIPTLHYIDAPIEAPGQVLELGRNVTSIESQLDFDDYASRIYATGHYYETTTVDGKETRTQRLITTCAMDATAEAAFGRVDRTYRSDTDMGGDKDAGIPDKTQAEATEIIHAEARAVLNLHKTPVQSLTMTAAELSDAGAEWKLFRLGTARRAICEPFGLDAYMTVQRIKRDHLDRAKSEVTLGREPRTLTRML